MKTLMHNGWSNNSSYFLIKIEIKTCFYKKCRKNLFVRNALILAKFSWFFFATDFLFYAGNLQVLPKFYCSSYHKISTFQPQILQCLSLKGIV